jgi:hypothetical protein
MALFGEKHQYVSGIGFQEHRVHLYLRLYLAIQIDILAGSRDGDYQGVSRLIPDSPLSSMRLPPPANRINGDRIMPR